MAASGAKYGMMTSQFYWIGAIPAMVFLAIFMMPFYYGSRARSVPEYLKLRFDEKTRGFNAISFAVMTVFSSGISLHALAKLMEKLIGWNYDISIAISAVVVLAYIFMGGLTSAIYNEVLQFFMIVLGFAPLVYLGLRDIGGWEGLTAKLVPVATQNNFAPGAWSDSWTHMASSANNPMGVEWFGMVMGLGFVLSFGYWCTDFLVVQRAMAANSMSAARRTPLIAAVPKMLFPFLVIVPGMIAIALTTSGSSFQIPKEDNGGYDYNMVIPQMLSHYFPNGLLGVGFTALMASFMSGMAGNVTAFNTVWTYDIYQSYLSPKKSEEHYLWMGRMATVFGILLSVLIAYLASKFNNIMDFLQLVFAFVNAPLFATFLLGMFWRRATGHGAFFGLLLGTVAAALHHGLTLPKHTLVEAAKAVQSVLPENLMTLGPDIVSKAAGIKGGWLGQLLYVYPSEMAQNFWTAIWAWSICFGATILISVLTVRIKTDAELVGLVYSLTPKPKDDNEPWLQRPAVVGIIIIAMVVGLNIIFW